MTLTLKDQRWINRVHDVAEQIRIQLKAMTAAEATPPAISHAAAVPVGDGAAPSAGAIYLAQTTDDLEEERAQVGRYLEQFGVLVLPAADLPGGGAEFHAAVQTAVQRADLYVHLLGPRAGRYPSDMPEGYGAAQLAAARQGGKPVMLWRHPTLDLTAVSDSRQRALLTDHDIVASGLESFKAAIRQRLEARLKPDPTRKAVPSLVFINASSDDRDVAQIVRQEFDARKIPIAVPLYSGSSEELKVDTTKHMRDCEILVFIYGEAPPSWVRAQMLQFSKVRSESRARLVALFVGPPDEKPTDIGFSLPDLRRVDFPHIWSVDPIRELIRDLEA